LQTARSTMSYLKMVTPREPLAAAPAPAGRRIFNIVDGEVREIGEADREVVGKAPYSSYGPGNLDPDSVRRHEANMKRFRFLGSQRTAPPPRGPPKL
jgi:nucleoside-diphosphate-sugar epimerase